jgi:hypothetical protein
MFTWIIQISFISIAFIFLVHHLLTFFKTTLTVPKVKDLVNSPNQKYQHIYETLLHNNHSNNSAPPSYTELDLLPNEHFMPNESFLPDSSTSSMKNELKSFLKKQLNDGLY